MVICKLGLEPALSCDIDFVSAVLKSGKERKMQWHDVIDLVAVVLSPEVVGTLGLGAVIERVLRPVGAVAGILAALRAAKLSGSSSSSPASAVSPPPSAKSSPTPRKPRSSNLAAANDNRPTPPDEYPTGYLN